MSKQKFNNEKTANWTEEDVSYLQTILHTIFDEIKSIKDRESHNGPCYCSDCSLLDSIRDNIDWLGKPK